MFSLGSSHLISTANLQFKTHLRLRHTLILPQYRTHLLDFRDNFNLKCLDAIIFCDYSGGPKEVMKFH